MKGHHAAFPFTKTVMAGFDTSQEIHSGLTKREYFAAMALQGYAGKGYKYKDIAKMAVEMADLLIEELNKEKE